MSTNMPSQLTNLLQNPALVRYIDEFSDLFRRLPQDLSIVFSNFLASTLDMVRNTLPPALTSTPPGNLALSQHFHTLIIELTSVLTILLGIVLSSVTLFDPPQNVSEFSSKVLTAMNTGLYGNSSLDLPDLLVSLYTTITNFHDIMTLPFSALTNFPGEIFSMLNNTRPPILHPLPLDLRYYPRCLVVIMFMGLKNTIRIVHEQLQHLLNDSPAAADDPLEQLTVQFVYKSKRDEDTDPDKCTVCMEEMKDGDDARSAFHVDCIHCWLEMDETCPKCRTRINAIHKIYYTLNGACSSD